MIYLKIRCNIITFSNVTLLHFLSKYHFNLPAITMCSKCFKNFRLTACLCASMLSSSVFVKADSLEDEVLPGQAVIIEVDEIETEIPVENEEIDVEVTTSAEFDSDPSEEIITAEDEVTVIGEQIETKIEPRTTLAGDELTRELGTTLGETLQNQAGVHNSTFGPGVVLPIIRGMSGSRIQILQGAMGSFDASSVSPDHAVPVDPLLIKQVEVLRGPSTLRYSGNAMGGAVDIDTGRIPEWFPEGSVDGGINLRTDSNSNQNSGAIKVDASKGPLVVHIDASGRTSSNIEIPRNALDEDAVIQIFGNTAEFENTKGEVLNSDINSSAITLGSSLVFDQGYLGAAYNVLNNNYGIPPAGVPPHSDDPTVTDITPENLRIDMRQKRWDAKTELYEILPGIDRVSVKAANVNYRHAEVARGVPVTTYDSEATEYRFEMDFTHNDLWAGSLGFQTSDQYFGAEGFEAFLPYTDIEKKSVFFIENFEVDSFKFEVGYRWESQKIQPVEDRLFVLGRFRDLPDKLNYDTQSISAAVQFDITDNLGFRLSYSKAERAPPVEELLSLGPHFATRSFTQGNPSLSNEQSNNLDIGINYQHSLFEFNANIYRNKITNYIYQELTVFTHPLLGDLILLYDIESRALLLNCVQVSQCFPVYSTRQQDAIFQGFETELTINLPVFFDIYSQLSFFSDSVRAYFTEEGQGDVPRVPPRRLGLKFDAEWGNFSLNSRWTKALAQKRPGLRETDTAGYDRVDVTLNYQQETNVGEEMTVFFKVKNISDDEIRHSTSFIRSFTPEPGRSLEAGIQWTF